MKKLIASFLFFIAFSACEKSPLFEEYDKLGGVWSITKSDNIYLSNGKVALNSCNFKNKNLKNGNHICTGIIQLNGGNLELLYKVSEDQTVNFTVSANGSLDPSRTNLPFSLFKGVWSYQVIDNKMILRKKESDDKNYLDYVLNLQKAQ
jgi:hypothetical protein